MFTDLLNLIFKARETVNTNIYIWPNMYKDAHDGAVTRGTSQVIPIQVYNHTWNVYKDVTIMIIMTIMID